MRIGKFNSDDHYIYYCGQESLGRNGVALIVKKRVQNAVLGCNIKNDRMILVHFQGKTFSITIIQVFKPATVLKKLKLNGAMKTYETKKRYHFHHRGLECENRKSRDTWNNRQAWPWSTK